MSPLRTDAPAPPHVRHARETIAREAHGLAALDAALADPKGLGGTFPLAVEMLLACRGRIAVSGIGKSGHIGRKIQATLASTGTASLFVHPSEAAHGDLGMIQPEDLLLALSRSGETPELASVLTHARRQGNAVIAITSEGGSMLARDADVALVLPQAEEACRRAPAPTTSALLQLAIGDALAVAVLEARGFTDAEFGAFHPGGSLGTLLRPVSSLMHLGDTRPLIGRDATLRDVILEMTRKTFGCVGVCDEDGRLVGLITDADLRRSLDHPLDDARASEIMNPRPITTTPATTARDALALMQARARPISSLFALDSMGRPIGIVHLHDLLRGVAS